MFFFSFSLSIPPLFSLLSSLSPQSSTLFRGNSPCNRIWAAWIKENGSHYLQQVLGRSKKKEKENRKEK